MNLRARTIGLALAVLLSTGLITRLGDDSASVMQATALAAPAATGTPTNRYTVIAQQTLSLSPLPSTTIAASQTATTTPTVCVPGIEIACSTPTGTSGTPLTSTATRTQLPAGPAPLNLLSAANFVILSETGITDTGSHTSAITGNIGSSPITSAAMTTVFCSEISGLIYGVNAAYVGSGNQSCFAGSPPSANKTLVDNAVLDMGTAYADAAGRTDPTATELGAGNIGGRTFSPGLYRWSTDVSILSDVTLSGGASDVWIFQIAGNLSVASAGSVPAGVKVNLIGGAQAANVFWQVGGTTAASLGTYSTFNGTILSAKQIILQTGAVLNGRALAQTQVVLDASTVTVPSSGGTPTPTVSSSPTATGTATRTPTATGTASSTITLGGTATVTSTPTITGTPTTNGEQTPGATRTPNPPRPR